MLSIIFPLVSLGLFVFQSHTYSAGKPMQALWVAEPSIYVRRGGDQKKKRRFISLQFEQIM